MKRVLLWVTLATLICGATAQANDSEAIDEGGVLVLKKSEHVVMESENLFISPGSVHVVYRFKNTGPADVDTLVAFPIAKEIRDPADEVPTEAKELIDGYKFELFVDGVARSVEAKNEVVSGQQNVTFYWRQVFPRGKTVLIEHKYTCGGGFIFTKEMDNEAWENLARDYCIDDESVATLRNGLRERTGWADQVDYILKTGANWAGPIGHFHLSIRKDRADQLVFLCAEGVRREDALTFVVDKTNFTPRNDLKIIFLSDRAMHGDSLKVPMPDATPPPPPEGIFGQPVEIHGDQGRERIPDEVGGGYNLWHIQTINGKQFWVPFQYVPPEKGNPL